MICLGLILDFGVKFGQYVQDRKSMKTICLKKMHSKLEKLKIEFFYLQNTICVYKALQGFVQWNAQPSLAIVTWKQLVYSGSEPKHFILELFELIRRMSSLQAYRKVATNCHFPLMKMSINEWTAFYNLSGRRVQLVSIAMYEDFPSQKANLKKHF